MNNKITTNSQQSMTEPKPPPKLSKLEQEQNHRNRDPNEGYQKGCGRGRMGKKV